jgi:hypothetical protein
MRFVIISGRWDVLDVAIVLSEKEEEERKR